MTFGASGHVRRWAAGMPWWSGHSVKKKVAHEDYPRGRALSRDGDLDGAGGAGGYADVEVYESFDNFNVGDGMSCGGAGAEPAAAGEGHRDEELVGEVWADGSVVGEPGKGLLRGELCDLFGCEPFAAEGGDELAGAFGLNLDHDCVAGADGVFDLFGL